MILRSAIGLVFVMACVGHTTAHADQLDSVGNNPVGKVATEASVMRSVATAKSQMGMVNKCLKQKGINISTTAPSDDQKEDVLDCYKTAGLASPETANSSDQSAPVAANHPSARLISEANTKLDAANKCMKEKGVGKSAIIPLTKDQRDTALDCYKTAGFDVDPSASDNLAISSDAIPDTVAKTQSKGKKFGDCLLQKGGNLEDFEGPQAALSRKQNDIMSACKQASGF